MTPPPIRYAKRQGREICLDGDFDVLDAHYLVVETPAAIVLVPEPGSSEARRLSKLEKPASPSSSGEVRGKDAQISKAFSTLGDRIPASDWREAAAPYTHLLHSLAQCRKVPDVLEDVQRYLSSNSAVVNSVEMLFTSIAMSARADWRSGPEEHRGVLARGWFLGRWIPTFLVLDGPISRFLKSEAFRRQLGTTRILREVRALLSAGDFVRLRHAFAHWSFRWEVTEEDSEIVGYGKSPSDEVRLALPEVDAFHIITYAIIEVIHKVFINGDGPPNQPAAAGAAGRRR